VSKKKWEYKLHTWVKDVVPSDNTFSSVTEFWVVCWRSEDEELVQINENVAESQRCVNQLFLLLKVMKKKLKYGFCRYSTRGTLNSFSETKKFKVSNKTLNPFQKPLRRFMKHILCWSNEGDLIIDTTSGSGTTAVSYLTSFFFELYSIKNTILILLSTP
jgi:hypothetical protein